ncbi:MAG: glycosyltransferase family 2 protein [Candidatus Curtissbacteria bacterium]|nr:glycosyltransferase family 2 protein [Candidatus Curtissbacteria bacterium]
MKKPAVTIAVCAYNEEENIANFLKSVAKQKEDGFVITKIIVHSDGSTDKTPQIVKSLNIPKVHLFEHKTRTGKSTHLNQIYKDLDTDFLVQTDADVIFAHEFVTRDMIKPLMKDKTVGMCGGNPEPISGNSYWEKVCKVAFEPYQQFRNEVRGGDNAFSAIGQILSYRRELVKQISIPSDMVTNDIFTYFCCLKAGLKYKFVKSGTVYYRAPKNLADIVKQNTRFKVGHQRMYEMFDSDMVTKELSVPNLALYTKLLQQVAKHPLKSTIYYLINVYCKFKTRSDRKKLDAKWPIAKSTKLLSRNQL